MIFHGQHRSFDLADRHRRDLEKQTGEAVRIISRRNAQGAFSLRGQHWIFESSGPRLAEFLLTLTYRKTRRSLDLIITAVDEADARQQADKFLRKDKMGNRITAANYRGWNVRVAEGKRAREKRPVEYRSESEEK